MGLELLRIHHLHIFVFVVDYLSRGFYLLAVADQLTQENQRKPGLRYIFIGWACVALAGLFCTRWPLWSHHWLDLFPHRQFLACICRPVSATSARCLFVSCLKFLWQDWLTSFCCSFVRLWLFICSEWALLTICWLLFFHIFEPCRLRELLVLGDVLLLGLFLDRIWYNRKYTLEALFVTLPCVIVTFFLIYGPHLLLWHVCEFLNLLEAFGVIISYFVWRYLPDCLDTMNGLQLPPSSLQILKELRPNTSCKKVIFAFVLYSLCLTIHFHNKLIKSNFRIDQFDYAFTVTAKFH